MIFPIPAELNFFGVYDAGVPNKERLVFQARSPVNLAQFGILVGFQMQAAGGTVPFADNFFWFGETQISASTWIVIMTGSGVFQATQHPTTQEPMLVFFWCRKVTMFENAKIVPVFFQLGAIQIGVKIASNISPLNYLASPKK